MNSFSEQGYVVHPAGVLLPSGYGYCWPPEQRAVARARMAKGIRDGGPRNRGRRQGRRR